MKMSNKGSLAGLSLGLVVTLVALFMGLYMIDQVSDVASIDNTSDLYSTFTELTSNVSTIYDVMILVIIIFALGVAISVLRNFAGSVGGGQEMAV